MKRLYKLDLLPMHLYFSLKKLKVFHRIFYNILDINVGGNLLLGGAYSYSDSVFKANSDFSDLCTSIKKVLT